MTGAKDRLTKEKKPEETVRYENKMHLQCIRTFSTGKILTIRINYKSRRQEFWSRSWFLSGSGGEGRQWRQAIHT